MYVRNTQHHVNARFPKSQRRSSLPLENAVDEQPILAVADEKEIVALVLVADLDMFPRDKGGVAHVHVDVPVGGAVTPDNQPVGKPLALFPRLSLSHSQLPT